MAKNASTQKKFGRKYLDLRTMLSIFSYLSSEEFSVPFLWMQKFFLENVYLGIDAFLNYKNK